MQEAGMMLRTLIGDTANEAVLVSVWTDGRIVGRFGTRVTHNSEPLVL